MALDDDGGRDEQRFADFRSIHDARNALATAWIRVQPTELLIRELTNTEDPANYYVCRALAERELSDEQRSMVATHVEEALSDGFRRRVPPKWRSKLDRLLLHCAILLRRSDARRLAHAQLQHRLAARRRLGIRVIHRLGVEPSDLDPARKALLDHKERQAITILAQLPDGLRGFDCCSLVQMCDKSPSHPFGDASYLGALALQGLANDGALNHHHASNSHPLYYIRAVGRLKNPALADYLQRSIEVGGVAVLPMAVSVAGRLQLVDILTKLEAKIARLVEEDPELYGYLPTLDRGFRTSGE